MPQDIQSLLPGALKLIAEQNKLKDIQPAGWVADRVPSTGAVIYQVSAVAKDNPNGPIFSVVIDDQGRPVDLKSLSKGEKVEFFPPFPRAGATDKAVDAAPGVAGIAAAAADINPAVRTTSFAALAALAAPVTINPSVNDLHLDPGQVFVEDIHVTTPATPDSLFDVYFLADTTGSMGSILNSVKAGAANILTRSTAGVRRVLRQ